MFVVTAALDQSLQHTFLADGYFQGRRVAPYDRPLFCVQQEEWLERLEAHFETGEPRAPFFNLDRDLGWCPAPHQGEGEGGSMSYDWSGSRIGFEPLPRTKTEGISRVLAIGCSFTRGDEVRDEESWPASLDRDVDEIEIANMGVGAYGIGQALIRMRRDGLAVEPDEVWLGVYPWASPRTVSMYRPAMRRWMPSPAFKPRFVLDESGGLELLPNPAPTLDAVVKLLTDQEHFLSTIGEHDFRVREFDICWLPKGSHIAHYSGFARLALTALEARPTVPPDYLGDTDSEVFCLMRAICLQIRTEAEASGARFRLLILPGRQDLASHSDPDGAYWSALVEQLQTEGVEVIDLSETLIAADAVNRDDLWEPGKHYSPAANRIVADGLRELIKP